MTEATWPDDCCGYSCEQFFAYIDVTGHSAQAAADDDLDPDLARLLEPGSLAALSAHVEGCPRCRHWLAAEQRMRTALADATATRAPSQVRARVLARIGAVSWRTR